MDHNFPAFDYTDLIELHKRSSNLYHSVGHIIRMKIKSGEWKVDQKIPSERSLSSSLNVSRATVRQGIENLVKEGILRKEQGRGTFIAPPKLKQGFLRLLESSEVLRESGLKPDYTLLGRETIEATSDLASALSCLPGDPLVCLQRLIRLNNSPLLIETSYFSKASFPNPSEAYDFTKDLRQLLEEYSGVQIARAQETFEPVILEGNEARQLGVESGSPALWVEHLVFDLGNAPVAYITVLIRGDRCRFYTDITFR